MVWIYSTPIFLKGKKMQKYKIKLNDDSLNCFQIPRITEARFTSIGDANSFLYSQYLDDSFHRNINLS